MKKGLPILLLILICSNSDVAPAVVQDLLEAMRKGHVRLISVTGNGNSSGAAVDASLENATELERHIDIHLSTPIFLRNTGAGQNMIGAQVLLSGGRYRSDGTRSFITVAPKQTVSVTFIAFCVDFEKENPSAAESFSVGSVPQVLTAVMSKIRQHLIAKPKVDVTVAGQLAVWLAQDHSIEEIKERFQFSPADEALARSLLR